MQELLTVIVTWLSINFGLPAIYEHPRVEFVSAASMAEVRSSRLESHRPHEVAADARPERRHDAHAIYDDLSRTIYLPEEWVGATLAEMSLLVHELVHHLQNVAGLPYDCAEAREKPAYQAQALVGTLRQKPRRRVRNRCDDDSRAHELHALSSSP